ncbi:ASST-domain-containing protein [Aspergillus unguis]
MPLTYALALLAASGCVAAQTTGEALWPLQEYKSSLVKAPYLNVTKMGKTEPGYLFFSPSDSLRGDSYPTIYSDDGQLVWQGKAGNISALQPQMLDGEPVIAYWDGYSAFGYGFGHITVLNSSYNEIHRITLDCDENNFVTPFDGVSIDSCIDIHESQITEDGTVLVTAVNVTQADLSSIGGAKDGWIQDGLVYEIDIKTNQVLFRWSEYEHVNELPMSAAIAPLGARGAGSGTNQSDPWGYPHINSIAKYGDSYLVSSRYMCSILFIAQNGSIEWHLDGRTGGDFELTLDTSFCYQHDVRFQSQSPERVTLGLHNNDNTEFTGNAYLTTGMVLELALQGSKQVTLKRRMWDAAEPVFANSQGSYQPLGTNGHVLMEHGATPKIEEYDGDGTITMRARFGYDNTMQTYRAYRYPWVGRPATKPDVVACLSDAGNNTAVYVSWNGATDVESWKVYSGSQVKKTALRNGFETAILVEGLSSNDSVVVEAVGGVGDGTRSASVTVQSC